METRKTPGALPHSQDSSQGLYDRRYEKDSCGIGFIAHIKNVKSHDIVRQGLAILGNLAHRGAVGADPKAGDGVGLLMQVPDRFLREAAAILGFELPKTGRYGVGMVYLPVDETARAQWRHKLEQLVTAEKQNVLGWRRVPCNPEVLGDTIKGSAPVIEQIFIGAGKNTPEGDAFERRLYVIRKRAENEALAAGISPDHVYIASLSSRTLVYKGMVLSKDLAAYFTDLRDSRVESALALVHQRFSTNTFPSWSLSQPFRLLCHNGEINTLRGNLNWMKARRSLLTSPTLKQDMDKLWPLIPEGLSDSACADHALEFLVSGGYSLAQAMMLMIPEAWADNHLMDEQRRAFYEYHAALTEPWDGPAAIAFTDGRQIGATLDRNGLRPARYLVTSDDRVLMASEMGVLDMPDEMVVTKWRLQPGKMLLVDLEQGRIVDDREIKETITGRHPYQNWLKTGRIRLNDVQTGKNRGASATPDDDNPDSLITRQKAFGYTREDIDVFLKPMALTGQEPTGSMGVDTPSAVLSEKTKPLYSYFKQCFAQVTNPAIDPIRENLVMSLMSLIGPRPNMLANTPDQSPGPKSKSLVLDQPILRDDDLAAIRAIEAHNDGHCSTRTIDITVAVDTTALTHTGAQPPDALASDMADRLRAICKEADAAIDDKRAIIILSDRAAGRARLAIPALLATSAVHHHLIATGRRAEVGLVVETGDARELHHFAVLAGYGAEAINPYLAFASLRALVPNMAAISPEVAQAETAEENYIKAIGKSLFKIMSKMGISTYQSYCGAQIFDAVGLNQAFIDAYFPGTSTTVEGMGLAEVARESWHRHQSAYAAEWADHTELDVGGEYTFRLQGESHAWTPHTVADLQHAVRGNQHQNYAKFAMAMNQYNERFLTLRGLMTFKPSTPVPLEEVEPAADIVRRFATGAMSFGSISREAHTTLAVAMNRIGGKSNTGEGGEESERFQTLANGDSLRSAIKQVASGRFGVTAEYLANADDIQIKICQGAKPGEGGQLPGHKVDAVIARVRHSTPGVGLISPPPHHDIYSIEDLAQLIFDLKNVNPEARISVKLASECGVGTVAAGVVKARADHVTIAGYDGGTGASPMTSIRHAGSPWEIGLAETHQTLVLNNLRGRTVVQVDGGLRTGRDVVIAAMLGADEFGFSSAPLVAAGCIMMRKCHLNTCPVGVATQNPQLRKRFTGTPDHVINYFFFVAEEIRGLMAQLGFTRLADMIGRVDLLEPRRIGQNWKAKGLDLSRLLHKPDVPASVATRHEHTQTHDISGVLDRRLIAQSRPALDEGQAVRIDTPIGNTDRSVGAMLSGCIAKKYGFKGLKEDSIVVSARGTAGQSFGAFLAHGVAFELIGEANDYVGKGLSGGRLVIYPPSESPRRAEDNIIVGNTVLYGAIAGECYFRGVAGERFAVRNSGAIAVVEGAGDHCCEYMTGGVVVCLGATGRNFAAGMSGGIAYVFDGEGTFRQRCNLDMVGVDPLAQPRDKPKMMDTLLNDLLTQDVDRLYTLLKRHAKYTNSALARAFLDDWPQTVARFVKVTPHDYRRALSQSPTSAQSVAQAVARSTPESSLV